MISISESNQEMFTSKILNDKSVETVFGNLYHLVKGQIDLFEDVNGSLVIKKSIDLKSHKFDQNDSVKNAKKKNKDEEYEVVALEDQIQQNRFNNEN